MIEKLAQRLLMYFVTWLISTGFCFGYCLKPWKMPWRIQYATHLVLIDSVGWFIRAEENYSNPNIAEAPVVTKERRVEVDTCPHANEWGASTSNTWNLGHSKKDWEDYSKASGMSPDHPLQLGSLQEAKQNSKGCCAHAPSELPTVWPTGSSNCDATPQGSKVAQKGFLVTLWVEFKENPWIMDDFGMSLWTLWTAHDNRESSIFFVVRSRRCAKEIAAMRRGWVTAWARLKLPGKKLQRCLKLPPLRWGNGNFTLRVLQEDHGHYRGSRIDFTSLDWHISPNIDRNSYHNELNWGRESSTCWRLSFGVSFSTSFIIK